MFSSGLANVLVTCTLQYCKLLGLSKSTYLLSSIAHYSTWYDIHRTWKENENKNNDGTTLDLSLQPDHPVCFSTIAFSSFMNCDFFMMSLIFFFFKFTLKVSSIYCDFILAGWLWKTWVCALEREPFVLQIFFVKLLLKTKLQKNSHLWSNVMNCLITASVYVEFCK